ncbi:MAG: FecR family protein, partial [Geminicoccales bacterium]
MAAPPREPKADAIAAGSIPLFAAFVLMLSDPLAAAEPCAPPLARLVSVQGTVELKRSDTDLWQPTGLDVALCAGDSLRVGPLGRAALVFANDSVLRLDERTMLRLSGPAEPERSLIDLILGAVHFFSHRPRALQVETPFVNAGAEGTEFLVRVAEDRTEIIVFDGRVLARNAKGEL